jgi:hypothetical protein
VKTVAQTIRNIVEFEPSQDQSTISGRPSVSAI